MARSARLVATGWARTNSRLLPTMQQKYWRPGTVYTAVEHHMPDPLRPQLLWHWWKADQGVNLAFGKEGQRLGDGMRDPIDVLLRVQTACAAMMERKTWWELPSSGIATVFPFRSLTARTLSVPNSSKQPTWTPPKGR